MDTALLALTKALADATRLQVLTTLASDSELSCGELVRLCTVSQSTMSHHLKTLTDCGLVELRPAGQRSLYRLRQAAVHELVESIADLLGSASTAVVRPPLLPERGLPNLGPGNVD